MTTIRKEPSNLRLRRMAKVVATLAEANGVTPEQVMMRISDNRKANREQFDMDADWTQYPATDEERKVAEDAAASTDATVEQLRAALKRKQAQYTREKQSIGSAYNEDNQTILFEQPQNTAEGNLFDVPRDFSQQVVETILKPLQAEIDNLQETIFKVEASKGKIIADAIAAHRAQQRLSFNDTPQAAKPLSGQSPPMQSLPRLSEQNITNTLPMQSRPFRIRFSASYIMI